jgi:hypothetical protein
MPLVPQPNFALAYAQQKVGGVLTPLSTSGTNSLLQDADPVLFYGLDFWASMIRLYEGDRFAQAVATAGIKSVDGSVMQDAVGQTYPWPPELEKEATQFRFPLLAGYWKDAKSRWISASYEDDRTTFDLLYILPPLSATQAEKILPLFKAIYGTLRKATTMGFDPNYYPPGGTAGQQPWALVYAGVEEIGLEQAHYGTWNIGGNLKFPFLHIEGFAIERDNYVPSTYQLAGVDTEVDLIASDGTIVANLMNTSTQQAPTITGLSPAFGPVAGGTSVTVTGTLFLTGPVVYLGTQRVYNVTWNSATSLTIVTPSYLNAGNVSITLINRDGQSVSVQNAFTYQ